MQPSSLVYDNFKRHFTATLRALCLGRGTHAEICDGLGINRQQFSKYLSGHNLPSAFIIQKFINYFDISADMFFLNPAGRRKLGYTPTGVVSVPDIKEGFYLEYAQRIIGQQQFIAISIWRIYRSHSSLLCRGQTPGAPNQQNKPTFDSYMGNIAAFGSKFVLTAYDANETRLQLSVLSRQTFGPNDLISVRINCMTNEAISGAATLFRYIGAKVDLVEMLVNECGLFELSALNERSRVVWTMFTQQVNSYSTALSVR